MKFLKNENLEYRDDNAISISKKRRTYNQRLISRRYYRFAPDDLIVDTDMWEGNPSVNKNTWYVGREYFDRINCHKDMLNKGRKTSSLPISGRSLFGGYIKDIIGECDE